MLKDIFLEIVHLNNAYTGSGMYMGLYYVVLIFILFFHKEKDMRVKIGYPALFILFFIFAVMPLLNRLVSPVILFDKDTGGRLFWVLLITIVVAYGMALLVQGLNSYIQKALLITLLIPVIFMCGVFKFSDALYTPIENEYRLPQNGLDICDAVLEEVDEPKLLVPYEIAHIFRQYSTKIKLLYGEDASYGRIQPVWGTEYHKACQEMDSTSPDVEFVATLAYRELCDFIVFDKDYHELDKNPEDYGYYFFKEIDHYDLYKRKE